MLEFRVWVSSNPTSPVRHALWSYRFGLELRVWIKSPFESLGLGFCFKHASAKARDGVRERNFGFPRTGHFVMKVILGNAHMIMYYGFP